MKSHIHYEAAFDACLRTRGVPFVPVDEGKKATFRDAKLKSFDFIVYSTQGTNWLVDIKGRRWQARRPGRKPAWENWITQEDCDGLRQWEAVFGAGFRAMLVFAYLLESTVGAPPELLYTHQEQSYIFVGIPLADYAAHARLRSPKWGTITMPTAAFAERCRPLAQWL
ncbi:MAG: HYExAFE family protein [Phycisphaerae bacterium]|nr:HYExAFE family protein [Phycisphaerae bacterium]